MDTDIVIVGAGICGLFAARELAAKGKKVVLLEAREISGGRIRPLKEHFSRLLDAGPEFIHGNLPLTKKLAKEAGAILHEQQGKFYRSVNGTILESEDMIAGWDRMMKELNALKEDVTLMQFLDEHFSTENDRVLKQSVIRLAEGFDAADASRISAFAVRDEWAGDSFEESYRIEGGYSVLAEYLTEECKNKGCLIHLNMVVTSIDWQQERITISSLNGQSFSAKQVIITVSSGILLSAEGEKGHIRFTPEIPEKIQALKQMGFGPVIKVNLEFKTAFWNDQKYKDLAPQILDLGFLNSDKDIPVWWTQAPDAPFLTGWAGGGMAERMRTLSDTQLFEKAIASLASAMNVPIHFLQELLLAHSVANWNNDPFTKGAYSYETPHTKQAKKILAEPLQKKLFFAGEALGEHTGTVEAALESAVEVVRKIMN